MQASIEMKPIRKIALEGLILLVFSLFFVGLAQAQGDEVRPLRNRFQLGIQIEDVEEGLEVQNVRAGGLADALGIQVGDIISSIEGMPITAETVHQSLRDADLSDGLSVSVIRDGETIELQLDEMPAPPQRPYIGIQIEETETGLVVKEIVEDSPASEAGLQEGDLIESVNETAVMTAQDVRELLKAFSVGDSVSLGIVRDGESQDVTLVLGALEEEPFGFQMPIFRNERPRLGVEFQMIHPAMAKAIGASITDGAYIIEVLPDSAAAEAGLMANDIIVSINEVNVDSEHPLGQLIRQAEGELQIGIIRDGEAMSLSFHLDKEAADTSDE
ncbi:hypothetical protein MASR2M15_08280 [Anaerolineales bacterium]